jgi:hypothetical protein
MEVVPKGLQPKQESLGPNRAQAHIRKDLLDITLRPFAAHVKNGFSSMAQILTTLSLAGMFDYTRERPLSRMRIQSLQSFLRYFRT